MYSKAFWFVGASLLCLTCQAQQGPSLVEVTPVVERKVATGQVFVGTAIPTRRVTIGSAVDGRVTDLFFREGYRVKKDDALVQLLTETIKLEIEAAKAELKLRRDELAELENGTRPSEKQQMKARMERSRISYEFLEKEGKRLARLHEQNATTASGLDRAITAALEAREQYDEAKAAYQLAVDGPRLERIEQARAQVAMQDALVRRLEDQMKKYTIKTRFTGYIAVKHTEAGAWLSRGDPVAEVVELDNIDIGAKVVERQIPYVNIGDSVRVEIPALPNHTFTGKVGTIIPQADLRSRTFPVSIRVANVIDKKGQPLIKAGMLARVTLATGQQEKALLVPKDALVLGGREAMVWIIDPKTAKPGPDQTLQGAAFPVPVQLGVADGDLIQVIGNISSAHLVVVRGNERIPLNPKTQSGQVAWKTNGPKSK